MPEEMLIDFESEEALNRWRDTEEDRTGKMVHVIARAEIPATEFMPYMIQLRYYLE